MDKKQINKILEEIYLVQPDLRTHHVELERVVDELIKANPQVKINADFKRELRMQIMAHAKKLDTKYSSQAFNFGFMQKFAYLLGGAVLTAIVIMPLSNYFYASQSIDSHTTSTINTITKLKPQAFGSLGESNKTVPEVDLESALSSVAPYPTTDSLILKTGTSDDKIEADGANGLGGGLNTEMAISSSYFNPGVPYGTKYTYSYVGDDLDLPESVQVLRRSTEADLPALTSFLTGNLDLIDLSQFKNTKLQNLYMVEDQDYGLAISIDFTNYQISAYQNWEKWPNASLTRDLSDLPDDDELTDITDKFLAKYRVDTSSYGQPVVQKYWEKAVYAEEEDFWIGDEITVLYPLKLAGVPVRSEWGNLTGLSVNIDLRNQKVSGFHGLQAQKFDSSEYEVVDLETLLVIAEKGGRNNWQPENPIETVEVSLGTPERVYMPYWSYKDGVSQDLLVEAYAFPILEEVADSSKEYVVIPLAQEILEDESGVPVLLETTVEGTPDFAPLPR